MTNLDLGGRPSRLVFTAIAAICLALAIGHGEDLGNEEARRESAWARSVERFQAVAKPGAPDWLRLADAQLRSGRIAEANESFETAIRLEPRRRPYLWQYGISLFFAGRFDDGKSLFEAHRQVNPNDVENAAWHFLCVAKSQGLDRARAIVLPAPDDPRPPMREILDRLRGGDDSAIRQRMKELEGTVAVTDATFYGHLYLGVIADAEGDRAKAKRWIDRAAQTPDRHYMADVARVYRQRLCRVDDEAESGDAPKTPDGSSPR